VKSYVSSFLTKLDLQDRTQAAILGLQQGLVPLYEALEARDAAKRPGYSKWAMVRNSMLCRGCIARAVSSRNALPGVRKRSGRACLRGGLGR
jgi:ribosomal protein S14